MISSLQSGQEVLDMDGDIDRLSMLLSSGCNVTAIAMSEEESERIKSTFSNTDVSPPNIYVQKSVHFDELEDCRFDQILAGSREEFRCPDFCSESFRLLRPGGGLLLIGPSGSFGGLNDEIIKTGYEVNAAQLTSSLNSNENEVISLLRPYVVAPSVPSRAIFRTRRLYMRPWKREDLDVEDSWPDFVHPAYRHYNPPRDPGGAKDVRFDKIKGLFDLRLSIFDEDGLAGYIALFGTDMKERVSEIGINFAAHKISRGYCKESFRVLCDAFFYLWGMDKIKLEASKFNQAGRRCYEATGFKITRTWWNPRAVQRFFNYENNPRLAPYRKHFRKGKNGVEVEFIEMEVTKDEYFDKFGQPEM